MAGGAQSLEVRGVAWRSAFGEWLAMVDVFGDRAAAFAERVVE